MRAAELLQLSSRSGGSRRAWLRRGLARRGEASSAGEREPSRLRGEPRRELCPHTHTPHTQRAQGSCPHRATERHAGTQAEARSLPEEQGGVGGEASGRPQAHVHTLHAAETPRARLAPPGTRRAAKESAARALCVTCGRCLRCRSLLASSKASSSLSASAYALLLSTSTLTSPPLDAMGRSARKRDFA